MLRVTSALRAARLCLALLSFSAAASASGLANTNGGRLLTYEIEGISLSTSPADIERILVAHGYKRANPVIIRPTSPQYTEHFIKGDYTSRQSGVALVYQSTPNGFAYEMRVEVLQGGANGQIGSIGYSRLPSVDPRMARTNPGPLPDTPDRKIIADLKAFVCSGFADETLRWRSCPPDTNLAISWPTTDYRIMAEPDDVTVALSARGNLSNARLTRTAN